MTDHDALSDELKLMRLPQVLEIVPVSHMTLYRMIKRGEFPAPLKIGQSSAWRYAEVKTWVDGLERGGPKVRDNDDLIYVG